MAILNNSNAISSGGYDINNSLRFRSSASAYLNRTPGSAGNRKIWTWSAWVKRGSFGDQKLFSGGTGTTDATLTQIYFSSTEGLNISGYSTDFLKTTQVFRDPSAWYHIVVVMDTTNATADNRLRIYINGNEVTTFSTRNNLTLNADYGVNNSQAHNIGRYTGASNYFDGYMTEINFVDGQALTPSSFGETDTTTGVWKPKAYTGTYGTNGFYLKFSDIATTSGSNAGLGKDFSGNGNYFNTNNISVTAGTTYDAMLDVPTLTSATVANYCVLNAVAPAANTLTNGNLKITAAADAARCTRGTIPISSGKWYWETTITSLNNLTLIGIISTIGTASGGVQATGNGVFYASTGNKYVNSGSATAYGATFTTGDVIGLAVDLDGLTITFYKNNTSQGSISLTADTYISGFIPNGNTSSITDYNFGQQPFIYTPPTGFVRLNTYNLPDSTIKKGSTVMDATLWTGNGTSQSIVNAGAFKPDFVWVKSRSNTFNNNLFNSTSGVNKFLVSDTTAAEASVSGTLTAFNSNGFSVGSDIGLNYSGGTYVGWQWQAGQGTTSSNTSGSITSTVSVNATAGFSVVTYTGTGANATVGHGLGVAPKFYMVKTRSTTSNWAGYHVGIASAPTQAIYLNLQNAANVDTSMWNSTAPTSSVFSLGTSGTINTSSSTYVAYCWAEIAGFSKFTSYVGNNSDDGPFVYLGFKPKFVMIKDANAAGYWAIFDSNRATYNVVAPYLQAQSSAAEVTIYSNVDFLANGIKLRANNANSAQNNLSGNTYIVAAFAENPFKNSLAR